MRGTRGWSCYNTRGNTAADGLSTALYEAAEKHLPGHNIWKDYTDGDIDLEKDYILRHTSCPSVLTENLFMDNREDVAFLESEEGTSMIIRLLVDEIVQYYTL